MSNKNVKISTYNATKKYDGNYFFILNKGLNSGKPLQEPCANCFICECDNEEEKNQLFWLLYGLWQGKIFHEYLTGSVIPFIHLRDVKQVIFETLIKINEKPDKFKSHIKKVQAIEQNRINILKQLELMKQLKRILMLELIK